MNKTVRPDPEVLLAVYEALSRDAEPEQMLDEVVDLLAARLPSYRCGVILFDEDSGDGVIAAAADDPAMRGFTLSAERYPELVRVRELAATVRIDDVRRSAVTEPVREVLARVGAAASLAVPIKVDNRVLGALFLRGAIDERVFTDADAHLLERVAEILAKPLDRARLLHRLRHERDRETALRKSAEQQLEQSSDIQSIFDRIPIGLANLDPAGRFTFVNRACCQLLGRRREDLLGSDFMDLIQFAEQPRGARIARPGRARRPRTEDLQITVEGQGTRLIEVSANPLPRDEDPQILVLRDITEERRQAREIEHTRDFLESVIQSSTDAIAAAGIDGRMILVNRAAEALFGYSAKELIGSDVRRLYPDDGAREIMRALRSDRHGGRGRAMGLRVIIKDRRGELVPVGMSASILYEEGRETSTVGIFHDLRPRQAIEDALREATDRNAALERSVALAQVAAETAPRLSQLARACEETLADLDHSDLPPATRAARLAQLARHVELLASLARGLENAHRLRQDAPLAAR